MRAKLIIQRSLAPSNLWHWIIIIDNNQEWEASKQSFKTFDECMNDAVINAEGPLLLAYSL